MRVLFTALVPSHFTPMVPLCWALRAAGHQVVVIGQADVATAALGAGLPARQLGEDDNLTRRLSRPGAVRKDHLRSPDAPEWAEAGLRWERRVAGYLEEFRTVARAWRPDLIVTDPVEFGGQLVAAALGVPVVVHRYGPEQFSTVLQRRATIALQGLAGELGVPRLPAPDLILDPTPASMQAAGHDPAAPIRFVPYNGTARLEDWTLDPPSRRRICLCLGMLGSRSLETGTGLPEEFASVLDLIGDRPGTEAVFVLPSRFHSALPQLPETVRLVGETPLDQFLAGCTAVVHHGGAGTTMTALSFGLPQLVLPPDDPLLTYSAHLVEKCGAGRTAAGPADLDTALTAVLDSADLRAGARDLRDEIDRMPEPAAVIRLLAALPG